MRLWIDDERLPPPGDDWVWVKTSQDAIDLLSSLTWPEGHWDEFSFDHDLGYNWEDGHPQLDGGVPDDTTRRIMLWMIENDVWPQKIVVHSANPYGAMWLRETARRYAPEGVVII